MARHILFLMSLAILCTAMAAADEPKTVTVEKPQWQRLLDGDDAKTAAELHERINAAEQADQYDEAIKLHEELLAQRTTVQGADHWETVGEKWELDRTRKVAALPAEQRTGWRKAVQGAHDAQQLQAKGQYRTAHPLLQDFRRWCDQALGEKHPGTALAYNNLAFNLYAQGKYAEAQAPFQKALDLRRELLGEKHPDTAASYDNLAGNLNAQGKYADAQSLHQKALDLRLELLGEKHPDTAGSYNNLAGNLNAQGKYAEAQAPFQKALDLRLELLGEKHPDTAGSYNNLAYNLLAQGKYAEAQAPFQKALDLRLELLGEKHPDTAGSYNNLAANLNAQGKYADAQPLYQKALVLRLKLLGEKHPDTAQSYNNLAVNLAYQGKYADAQPLYQKALDLYRERLGEKHPDTATSYNNLATNLDTQGKYADAQPLYQKALVLRLELLGEKHSDTAASYNHLAANLNAQGNYADAQPLYQKALVLRLELLGEKHPDTATIYGNLAYNLQAQGKYAEAQPLFQKALGLCRELLGEKHPDTTTSYNNLATNLDTQGKYADAQPLYQKALVLRLELLGEKHPDTAASYNHLAANLADQGKYADAQPLFQKALDLYRELLGEKHPDTALSYNNLAGNLSYQGKYADAQPLYQKALDFYRELLGEKHPHTAQSYNNLAANLLAQGKYAEAQPLFQKVLDLRLERLGEKHPDTALSYNNLALNLAYQGKYADAQLFLTKAATSYEAARLNVARRGLDRAVFGAKRSPYRLQAATEAQLAKASRAWVAAETDLARGLCDETASRRGVALTTDEENRQAALTARLNQLQPLILQLVSKQSPSDEDKNDLGKLQNDRRVLENELAELAVALSQRELATLAQVQAAIPSNAALLLWVDITGPEGRTQEHWGCEVREAGDPIWERLCGTGPEGKWTADDLALPREFSRAVVVGAAKAEIDDLADKLYAQRIAPLEKHLEGVTRLFVVPVNTMAGVPVEVLSDNFTISYVPSGTFLARLKDRPASSANSLLALGDPVFPPAKPPKTLPLPPGGLLITQVIPGGNADRAKFRAGDVLLKYAGDELTSVKQVGKLIQQHSQDQSITVNAWREGETADRDLGPGRLGVVLDRQPAPEAIADKRKADQMLLAIKRGGDWAELPGSAIEVARLMELVGDDETIALTRSAASEQEMEQLRADGKLAEFRYLHFATHGEPNNARSFESALILSQDQVSTDIPPGGGKYFDGRLTANEVLEIWELNADLVTLSACESALGRPGGGDGVLGFAQAFLLVGSRAVCLSLWKVDDTATALLMDRFYQNLLGKRAGLAQPMPKAAALAEAKRWLRELSADEATTLAADMTSGVAHGKGQPALKLAVPTANPQATVTDDEHPFSHPRYWAAFVLIGDPD